jgi:Xaa-Pro dipeptidase
MNRRRFLARSALAIGAAGASARCTDPPVESSPSPSSPSDAIADLRPLTPPVAPISAAERDARVENARRLMREQRIDAMFLESGSSLFYYTGVRWGLSERPFGAVIPARGSVTWISPAFEEQRARELTGAGAEIRLWEEDEDPCALIAGVLRDHGAGTGRVGIDERVRFFIVDGLRAASRVELVSATPVTAGCRTIKSPAEIALMQRANDITLRAIGAALQTLHEGMTQNDLESRVGAATTALGGRYDGALVSFGAATAFPHGSRELQRLRAGDFVLIDAGCTIDGYTSDITRTMVFGTPTPRQREIWDLEKRAQTAALKAAQPGATCHDVDAAARKVITDAGFGPGYRLPGLPHRTGHGIGIDGHEWTNFVRGNMTRLRPGMCFSDEPTIVIDGEFGVRLEDCLYITESGPVLFTKQSPAIDDAIE